MAHEDRPTRRDSWWRSAPVLVIAVLALVMSTAGGAYAVAKNSIGTKQLKNNAVTSSKIKGSTIQSSDVKNGSLTASDLAPGTIPVVPPAGPKVYFAKVNSSGALLASSPGINSVTGTGGSNGYRVKLDFDPTKCALVSTGDQSPDNTSASITTTNTVGVFIRDVTSTGSPYATGAFSLVIVC